MTTTTAPTTHPDPAAPAAGERRLDSYTQQARPTQRRG